MMRVAADASATPPVIGSLQSVETGRTTVATSRFPSVLADNDS
jgi:hypothetical protein